MTELNRELKAGEMLKVEYGCGSIKQKHVILMDINLLPTEYKSDDEGIKKYEERYNVRIIPYDTSRENIQGSTSGVSIQYLGRE